MFKVLVLLLVLLAGFSYLSIWLNATPNSYRAGWLIVAGCVFCGAILGLVYGVFQPTECSSGGFIALCFPLWPFTTAIGASCGLAFSILVGIIRRTAHSPMEQIRNVAILVSVVVIIVLVIQRIQATYKANQDTLAKQQRQDAVAQFRQDLPIFNQSLAFTNCQDTLVAAEQQPGYYDISLTISTIITQENEFEFTVFGDDFGWPYVEQRREHLATGRRDLTFRIPTLVQNDRSSYQENIAGLDLTTNITRDGPYKIRVRLVGVHNINGRSFWLGSAPVDYDKTATPSIVCTTKPYRMEDFGLIRKTETHP